MTPRSFRHLRRFSRANRGVIAIEFALIAPIFVLMIFGCLVMFILFRESGRAERATFTVADIVSRQTTVTSASLAADYALFRQMLSASNRAHIGFRISSLRMSGNALSVVWSYPVAPMAPLTTATIPTTKLPLVTNNDSLVVVETNVGYDPILNVVGLGAGTYRNIAANRPRFTAAIAKSD